MDQDSTRPKSVDENGKQVRIRGSSSIWLLTPVEKENGWLERHLKRLCCSHRSCHTVTNTVTDTVEHTFTLGMRELSTRGALILNFVKDFQQDTAMKNSVRDCLQNGLFQELPTNGSWTVEEGLSPRLCEGRAGEHKRMPHFSFLFVFCEVDCLESVDSPRRPNSFDSSHCLSNSL